MQNTNIVNTYIEHSQTHSKKNITKNKKTTFIKNVGISFSIVHISMWGFFYGTNGKKNVIPNKFILQN